MGAFMPSKLDSKIINFTCATLKKEKVFTLERVVSLLDCSRRTAQTKLSQWGTCTSYNHNSKYYTFQQIPKFDINGLWWYKNIAFSKSGNLKKTIIHLVNSSLSGLTGKEIGGILGLVPGNFVHHFRDCPSICREKHDGVYIHFSSQPSTLKDQKQRRVSFIPTVKNAITEEDAIIILVAIINHHGISPKEIMTLPEVNKRGLSESAIQNFMKFHGLEKKNPSSRP